MYDSKITYNRVYANLKIMYFSKNIYNIIYIVYIQLTDWNDFFFHPQRSAGNPFSPGQGPDIR